LEELDIDQVHSNAFAASSDPDTFYLHEAMRSSKQWQKRSRLMRTIIIKKC
jgi:hypothetical protein